MKYFRYLFLLSVMFFVLGCSIVIPSLSTATSTPVPTVTVIETKTPVPTNTSPVEVPTVDFSSTQSKIDFSAVSLNNVDLPAGWKPFTIDELRAKGLDLSSLTSSLTASIPQLKSLNTSAIGQIDNLANFGFAMSFVYGIEDSGGSAMADLIIASPDQILQGLLNSSPGATAEVDKTALKVGENSVVFKGIMNKNIGYDFLISRRQNILQFLLNMWISPNTPSKTVVDFGKELDGMILKALGQ